MLSLSLPVSLSPLWSGQHGPGLLGTGRCPCMSPRAEPRQLPRYPSPLPCPAPRPGAAFQSSSTGMSQAGLVPKCQAEAAAEGPGGGSVVTPQCRDLSWAAPTAPLAASAAPLWASDRGIRTPFSRAPPAPGSGDPRPCSFPHPVSACGQRGPCQSCLNPTPHQNQSSCTPPGPLPSPRGCPGGGTRGDSAGWVPVGRGACDSFARSRTQELTLRTPPLPPSRGWLVPAALPPSQR